MKKRILGILLVLAALVAVCVISVSAEDVDFSAGGKLYCQHCKTDVEWLPLTQELATTWGKNYDPAAGSHYYVSDESVKLSAPLEVLSGETLCLHLNGKTVYRSGARPFSVTGILNLMDHAANKGLVYGYAESTTTGCVVRVNSSSKAYFNMYGGTLEMRTGSHSRAKNGGSVYVDVLANFNLHGGTITGGRALNGGNVYIGAGSKFNMYGGTISNGTAVNNTGDNTTGLGGNIYLNGTGANGGATANISGGTVTGGSAVERGGNLVTTATNITVNISGNAAFTNGTCEKSGGNLYLNNGNITISGGTFSGGKAGLSGGNIYANAGYSNTTNYVKLLGGTFTGGTAVNYGGNIYVSGKVTLGNCNVTGGTCGILGNCMYVTSTGNLKVTADFAGEATACFYSGRVSKPVRGGSIQSTGATCEGPFTGKLMIENDSQLPEAYGKTGETTLYIKAAAIVKTDGTKAWYDTNAQAVAAYDSTADYLVANQGDLALDGGEYKVDLCGANVNVTGTGSVTFLDSANADYTTYGTATVTGVTVNNDVATKVAGDTYYMVQSGSEYSFHRLDTALTNVNIRPANTGIYYDGAWKCDDLVKNNLVASYGVAVSLVAMPNEKFATNNNCLYTEYSADTLESGTAKTGVIIQNILDADEDSEENDAYGRKPIYARTYVKLTDGTVIMSDTGAAESLHSSFTRLDGIIKDDTDASIKYLHDAREFYNTWKDDGMGTWELNTIPTPEKVQDGVLNLMMVGNSFCYFYVEELYALLTETLPEGIQEVNIYNLYYSGCTLTQHNTWWKEGQAKYQLFKMDANGRSELFAGAGAWSLEEALALENWDYISLQGNAGGSYMKAEERQTWLGIAEMAEPLLDRFHDLYPNAQLLWHRTWYFEIGRVGSDGYVYTEEGAYPYDHGMQICCDYMCEEFDKDKPYDLVMVNSGAAWWDAREMEAGKDLLPFGGLCAMLGRDAYGKNLAGYTGETANSGDGYHDGDIGGGQLINAYAWYETLTGKDCRETVYRPTYSTDYTLSEDLVKILQEAAHGVVSEMPETVKPAK